MLSPPSGLRKEKSHRIWTKPLPETLPSEVEGHNFRGVRPSQKSYKIPGMLKKNAVIGVGGGRIVVITGNLRKRLKLETVNTRSRFFSRSIESRRAANPVVHNPWTTMKRPAGFGSGCCRRTSSAIVSLLSPQVRLNIP